MLLYGRGWKSQQSGAESSNFFQKSHQILLYLTASPVPWKPADMKIGDGRSFKCLWRKCCNLAASSGLQESSSESSGGCQALLREKNKSYCDHCCNKWFSHHQYYWERNSFFLTSMRGTCTGNEKLCPSTACKWKRRKKSNKKRTTSSPPTCTRSSARCTCPSAPPPPPPDAKIFYTLLIIFTIWLRHMVIKTLNR